LSIKIIWSGSESDPLMMTQGRVETKYKEIEMKAKKMVSYKGKVYQVKSNQYCGFTDQYKLISQFEHTSYFGAKKDECIEVHWSEALQKFVTIPQ
jgi:hypothetical protein